MKTSELTGTQLDYWVAMAEGLDVAEVGGKLVLWRNSTCGKPGCAVLHKQGVAIPAYSADWAQCGPLVEKYSVELRVSLYGESEKAIEWLAKTQILEPDGDYWQSIYGEAGSPLVAICRAVVRSVFGDEVQK